MCLKSPLRNRCYLLDFRSQLATLPIADDGASFAQLPQDMRLRVGLVSELDTNLQLNNDHSHKISTADINISLCFIWLLKILLSNIDSGTPANTPPVAE